jgi:hypothetical protein
MSVEDDEKEYENDMAEAEEKSLWEESDWQSSWAVMRKVVINRTRIRLKEEECCGCERFGMVGASESSQQRAEIKMARAPLKGRLSSN